MACLVIGPCGFQPRPTHQLWRVYWATRCVRRCCTFQSLPSCSPACSFKGVYDVRQAIDAAAGHRVLHPLVLGAIATTLEAAARLQAQLQQQGEGGCGAAFPALQQLGAGIGDALPGLRQAIEQCIQVKAQWG